MLCVGKSEHCEDSSDIHVLVFRNTCKQNSKTLVGVDIMLATCLVSDQFTWMILIISSATDIGQTHSTGAILTVRKVGEAKQEV